MVCNSIFTTINCYVAQIVPGLAIGDPFRLASVSLALVPFFVKPILISFSSFLPSFYNYFRLICTFPGLFLESTISPKRIGSLLERMVFRNQNLGTSCAHCFWGTTILSSQCTELYIYKDSYNHIYFCIYLYIH